MDFVWLRFLLASSVVITHFHVFSGGSASWLVGVSGTVAVQAFFVISGWIVTSSYFQSATAASFFVRRFARLVPLYAVVVVVQAIAVVAFIDFEPSRLHEVWRYLAVNLAFANFLQPSLLGFLDDAPVQAINPSLWALKIEVLYYLTVPLWVWISRRMGWWGLAGLFVASTVFVYAIAPMSGELAKQLPGQLRFFVIGMVCQRLAATGQLERLPKVPLVPLGALGLWLAHRFDASLAMSALQPAFVAVFVLGAMRLLPLAGRMPDISYGVYLLHAPIIQFARHFGWIDSSPQSFFSVLLVTLVLAWAAAYAIERPAIRAGRRWSNRLEKSAAAAGAHVAGVRQHAA